MKESGARREKFVQGSQLAHELHSKLSRTQTSLNEQYYRFRRVLGQYQVLEELQSVSEGFARLIRDRQTRNYLLIKASFWLFLLVCACILARRFVYENLLRKVF
jgi:hypothetical protein